MTTNARFMLKLEDMVNRKGFLWLMGIIGTVFVYSIVMTLDFMFETNVPIRVVFSAFDGIFLVALIYAWSRVSVLNRDVTTGLFRRSVAEERLKRIAATHTDVTVCMIDLNRLKAVNDAEGHDKGDDFIKMAARRLSRLQRHKGGRRLVSRFGGGDEFLVIAQDMCDPHELVADVEEALHAKHPLNGEWGIGVAGVARSRRGETRVALECADTAMYRAKREYYATGVSRVVQYDCVLDGEPKYDQFKTPPRPKQRQRDGGDGGRGVIV